MPANLVSAVVVGRLLEDRYRLERRDAFLYALVPQLAGMPEAPALAVSIALGRRNEPPPPVVATGVVGTVGEQPADAPVTYFIVPDLTGKTRSDLESMAKQDSNLNFVVEGPENGTVSGQKPPKGTRHEAGQPIYVTMAPGK